MKRKLPEDFPKDNEELLKNEDLENNDNDFSDKSDQENPQKNAQDQNDPLWVCLRGVDRYDTERKIYNNLNKNIPTELIQKIISISKPKQKNMSFIHFQTTEDAESFKNLIQQGKLNKRPKQFKAYSVFKNDKNLKYSLTVQEILQDKNQNNNEKANIKDIEEELKIPLEEKICPLYKTPYKEQIQFKKGEYLNIIKTFQQRALQTLKADKDKIPDWVVKTHEDVSFIECEEQFFNYRNKSEFTIGKNHENKVKVGFNRTNFDKKIAFIDDASKNCLSSQQSIQVAEALEQYIITSPLQAYDRFVHQGFWRYLVVRQSFNTLEMLINIVVKYGTTPKEQIDAIKQDLIELFINKNTFQPYKIVSLNMQNYEEQSDSIPQNGKIEVLYGKTTYEEKILNKSFKVSPNAFLQIHTKQCEKLYSLIGSIIEKIGLNEKTVFLDICSGIGTIGICLAQKAKQVIGIECVQSACEDAEENIKENNVNNYTVICGKVEDVIQKVVQPLVAQQFNIIGVVDPPRAGLNTSVVKALRTCKGLNHLVYVACNPQAVCDNLLSLCLTENKRRKAPAFHVVEYFGCDLFPQTKHFEAVFYLQRYPVIENPNEQMQ